MADHIQELGAHPLQLHQRGQVLKGDDHRLDAAVLGRDRGEVDKRPDPAPVGDLQDHLLGTHGLGAAQQPAHGQSVEGDLPPIGAPAGGHFQQLLQRTARLAQGFHDPLGLPVDRHRPTGPGLEDHHPHRGGVDQGLQIGTRPLLVPVRARVGDRGGRLRGEQQQDFFVFLGEVASPLLAPEEEVADFHFPMPHRGTLKGFEGFGRQRLGGKAQGADVAVQVGKPQGSRKAPQVFEQTQPVGPFGHLPVLLGTQAGTDEVLGPAGFVDGGDDAAPGSGQGAGAVHDLAQDFIEFETGADAQDRRAQPGEAVAQLLVLPPRIVLSAQHFSPPSGK